MQFTTAFLASAAAMTASALPQAGVTIPENARFGLITIRSGSPIQNLPIQAAARGLYVGLPSQNSTCDVERDTNYATFYLEDTELHLHAASAYPQTMFVDRSGMGQGIVGYTSGAEPVVRNGERKGWALNENNELEFNGVGLQACPNAIDGAWRLWLAGSSNPGGYTNCTGVSAVAYKTDNPISCLYTQEWNPTSA
ncbi:unnamed protein product [Periconia digitata]|uniref:Cell wall protein PhiA n=1 Tax=Periconia digitata TaxID=1303443 RepID=A0A9W4UP69_9PLEO|nr:unnamed protein product [Periconia digitata]